jgi:3-methyladenine DNA glycosylase AlkD
MDIHETLRELELLGSEQTRKTFLRHGAPAPLYGVSFASLGTLQRRLKKHPELAEELWATRNADARMLATLVVDPATMSWPTLQTWAEGLDWHTLTDVFVSNVASHSQHARRALESWTRSDVEWVCRAGWQLLAVLVTKTTLLTDEELAPWLPRIEQGIGTAKNRVREAMNTALIALGGRGGALETAALAAAKRIGKVEVDHGDTACKTPDAAEYIRKMHARRAKKSGAPAKQKAPETPARKSAAAKKVTRPRA